MCVLGGWVGALGSGSALTCVWALGSGSALTVWGLGGLLHMRASCTLHQAKGCVAPSRTKVTCTRESCAWVEVSSSCFISAHLTLHPACTFLLPHPQCSAVTSILPPPITCHLPFLLTCCLPGPPSPPASLTWPHPPCPAPSGEVLTGFIECRPNAKNPRDLDIALEYSFEGKNGSAPPSTQQYRMR